MPEVKIIADLRECEQSRVAVLENGRLAEIFIDYNLDDENIFIPSRFKTRPGDIFKARVDKILPAINAAFCVLSKRNSHKDSSRNAFIYLSEISDNPDDIKPGRELIVQVIKNSGRNKAPRVSTRISLPGRYLVLVPGSEESGVSRRIEDNSQRKRLKKIADELKAKAPGFGVVIRTAAISSELDEKFLHDELDKLLALWDEIINKTKNSPAPCLLYREAGTLGRVLRDEVSGKIDEIIIDNQEEYERAKVFMSRFFHEESPSITLYSGLTPIFDYYGIENELAKTLERKVWLKSGAYLIIDQTEALTVIDVNTGKFTKIPDMRQTILAANLEAAEEVARQLRLRSIGGIIIIDFIDMQFNEDKEKLLTHFEACLKPDRMKPHVMGITKLGLVEMTRKRERPDIKNILTRNCPVCVDYGFVEREENIAMNIRRFIRKVTGSNNSEAFLLTMSVHMAKYISNYLSEWQEEFGRKLLIAGVSNFDWNKYKLEYQGSLINTNEHAKSLNAVIYK
ncbi:MAG: Rne/Rng family ribonuclease [Synergistaceae bacterium]|nr:Rne/Rng family ribonuclease [Synergistaceae bacterium]